MQNSSLLPRRLPTAALIVAVSHFMLEMCSNMLPALYPLLQAELDLNFEQIGRLALVGTLAGSLPQPFFGWLADRTGSRWITLGSVVFLWVFMSLIGVSPNYLLVMALIVLARLGSASYHPPAATLVRETNTQASGLAMSIFSVSGNWGSAAAPVFIAVFLGWYGLRGTLALFPLALVLGGILFFLFLKLPTVAPRPKPVKGQRTTGPWLAIVIIILVVGTRTWVQGALSSYIPLWLIGQGVSETAAAAQLSMVLFSMGIGSLIGGPLSDWLGRVPVMYGSLILMILAQLVYFSAAGPLQTLAGVLVGIGIGLSFPITLLLAQDAWPNAIGLASALIMGIGWIPFGVGSWVVGLIADASSLEAAMQTLIWVPAIGVVVMLFWRNEWSATS